MRLERTRTEVRTKGPVDIVDVTNAIERWLDSIQARDGMLTVFVPHTTAGIFLNEAEAGLIKDIEGLLERIAPAAETYHHNEVDNNAHAHLRSVLLRSSLQIPVNGGKLLLGTWQRVLFYEGDGPRTRTILLTYIGL